LASSISLRACPLLSCSTPSRLSIISPIVRNGSGAPTLARYSRSAVASSSVMTALGSSVGDRRLRFGLLGEVGGDDLDRPGGALVAVLDGAVADRLLGGVEALLDVGDDPLVAGVGLIHFLGRVEAARLVGERAAQRERLGALGQHQRGHLRPEAGELAVVVRGGVLAPRGDGEKLDERAADDLAHGHLRRRRDLALGTEPDVAPHAVRAAPVGVAGGVGVGAVGDQAQAVDRDLHAHLLVAEPLVVAVDRVNLAAERVEARAVALVDEELQLVVGRLTLGGHELALDQPDLLRGEGAADQLRALARGECRRHR
jgi:hypothetical protein